MRKINQQEVIQAALQHQYICYKKNKKTKGEPAYILVYRFGTDLEDDVTEKFVLYISFCENSVSLAQEIVEAENYIVEQEKDKEKTWVLNEDYTDYNLLTDVQSVYKTEGVQIVCKSLTEKTTNRIYH